MSYFPIDTCRQEMTNRQSVDTSMTDRHKNLKYARHIQPHTDESKKKISETQQRRYALLRIAVDNAIDDNRIRHVVREEIDKLLKEMIPVKPNNNKPNIPVTYE